MGRRGDKTIGQAFALKTLADRAELAADGKDFLLIHQFFPELCGCFSRNFLESHIESPLGIKS